MNAGATHTIMNPTLEPIQVYAVTWADNAPPDVVRRWTPPHAIDREIVVGFPPAWLALGSAVDRLRTRAGQDANWLEWSTMSLGTIAESLASGLGMPAAVEVGERTFELDIRHFTLGTSEFVALVQQTADIPVVAAMYADSAKHLCLQIFGSAEKRDRLPELVTACELAVSVAHKRLDALLGIRKAGVDDPNQAKRQRLGQLLGGTTARLACSTVEFMTANGVGSTITFADDTVLRWNEVEK